MSCGEPVNIEELLVRTDGMTAFTAGQCAREIYEQYVDGQLVAHDGQRVWFFSNRFEHAFRRDNSGKGGEKNEIDFNRVQRARWIEPVIAGHVAGTVCRLVPDQKSTDRGSSRLYMVQSECYVVWLLPKTDGTWTFSTAYKAFGFQMKKYRQLGVEIWRREQ